MTLAIKQALALTLLISAPGLTKAEGQTEAGTDVPARLSVPQFVEEAAAAGIEQRYEGGWEFFVGGGGSAFDCNRDGMPDLALAGGSNRAALYVNAGSPGGALKFAAVGLGLDDELARNVLGIYALDIDADQNDDLVLLRLGENVVLRGLGGCRFERADQAWKIGGGQAWTTAFAATWEAGNRFPTLAFGNYVDRDLPGAPWGTCADNVLMRPGAGAAPDYSDPTALTPGYCSLGMIFSDWNGSGVPALRITNDRQYYRGGEEQLWRVEPGTPPRLYGRADGWEYLKIWGMGIATADLDGDGLPEYALTSMGDTRLQSLDDPARPQYTDVAYARGATAQQPYVGPDKLPSTGWHAEFADFNNDGREDLFIAKGNVEAMPEFASFDPDNLLLQSADGRFVESGDVAGIALDRPGRGAIVEDFNRDGLLDLLVINRKQNVSLFRNLGNQTGVAGNWIEISLKDRGGNTRAVGARIEVRTSGSAMNRTIRVGGGHAAGHSGPTHIGLAEYESGIVRIKWPDGSWSDDYSFQANRHITIRRDEAGVGYGLAIR